MTDKLSAGLRERGVTLDIMSANEIKRWVWKEYRLSSLALAWPEIQKRLGDYHILHVHGIVPSFSDVGLLFGRMGSRIARPGSAVVYTHHCDIDIAGLDLPVRLYNQLHHRLVRLADHSVASTPTYARRLARVQRPGRVSTVRFGVIAEEFQHSRPKPDRFTVLFVGQLRPYKGVDVLLKAWRGMENADLHIVGDGHERKGLEALAAELELKSVTFHGAVSDEELRELYAQSHALVLPSTRKAEAFGLVLLEGMSAGCVPVASDLPGVSDVVGATGCTFPVGDSEALAACLRELRDRPDHWSNLAELASGRAVAWSWNYTAEAYLGVYKQALLGRRLELLLKHDPDGGLQRWLRLVSLVTGAGRASLMLRPPGTRELRIAAAVGLDPEVVASTRLPLGHRVAGYAAQTGRSMLVRRRGMPALARLYGHAPELSSSLVLPLLERGRAVGVLNLGTGARHLPFTGTDEHWLQRLSTQIAPLLSRGNWFPDLPPVEEHLAPTLRAA